VERPTADPLADLRGAMRLVANQCGASADLVVMGRSAADAFESNPDVLNAFDKQRINQGVLSASNLSWGVISLGSYRGVTLHVYEAEYQGSDEAIRSRLLRPDRFEQQNDRYDLEWASGAHVWTTTLKRRSCHFFPR
jgi:major capsid protein E